MKNISNNNNAVSKIVDLTQYVDEKTDTLHIERLTQCVGSFVARSFEDVDVRFDVRVKKVNTVIAEDWMKLADIKDLPTAVSQNLAKKIISGSTAIGKDLASFLNRLSPIPFVLTFNKPIDISFRAWNNGTLYTYSIRSSSSAFTEIAERKAIRAEKRVQNYLKRACVVVALTEERKAKASQGKAKKARAVVTSMNDLDKLS